MRQWSQGRAAKSAAISGLPRPANIRTKADRASEDSKAHALFMEAGRDRERPIESEHRACTSFTVENQARCLEITACSAGTSFWLALTVTHGTDPLYRVVTELQSICGRFRDRVRETCRPVEIRLWLSSQRKQPVPHKHPYERSRQAKASRHGQKHLSGGDIYFGGPFIV